MAFVSFRTPQEGLEQYKQALDMMSLIRDIATNPEVHAQIAKISIRLSDAQRLSDKEQTAMLEAQEIITQSKEHLEEFAQKQAAYSEQVKNDRREIDLARKKLENETQVHLTEKAGAQEMVRKNMALADEKLIRATTLNSEAALRNTTAERLEKEISAKMTQHKENVRLFEEAQKISEEEFTNKLIRHQNEVRKLSEERSSFELRKKRFDDAIRE